MPRSPLADRRALMQRTSGNARGNEPLMSRVWDEPFRTPSSAHDYCAKPAPAGDLFHFQSAVTVGKHPAMRGRDGRGGRRSLRRRDSTYGFHQATGSIPEIGNRYRAASPRGRDAYRITRHITRHDTTRHHRIMCASGTPAPPADRAGTNRARRRDRSCAAHPCWSRGATCARRAASTARVAAPRTRRRNRAG